MKIKILLLLVVQYSKSQDYSRCGRTKMKTTDSKGDALPGNNAVKGEFPNMCTLYLRYKGSNIFTGGASLIGPNQVLTLASGVSKYRGEGGSCGDAPLQTDLFVSCGSADLQPLQTDPNKQTRKVKSILIHPQFNPKSLINDMAVLMMDSPFDMTEYVGPACLPEPSFDPKNFFCVATGHGLNGEMYYTKELQRSSQLRIWDREDCEATFNSEYFKKEHNVTWKSDSSFICAGGDRNVDTCEGDGGGPLVCLVSGDYDVVFDGSENIEEDNTDDNTIDGDTKLDLREDDKIADQYDENEDVGGIFGDEYNENEDVGGIFGDEYDENEDVGGIFGDDDEYDEDNDVGGVFGDEEYEEHNDVGGVFGDNDEYDEYDDVGGIFGDNGDEDYKENNDAGLDLREDDKGLNATYLVQVGIVAWGFECGKENIPSVYSNLMSARCWLDQIMSCYKHQNIDEDNLDLRGSDDEAPISVGGLTESQCGSWLESSASDAVACGCKQKLRPDKLRTDDGTLGLREAK